MKIKELIALHTPPVKYLKAWGLWQHGEIARLGYGRPAYVLNGKLHGNFTIDENDMMLIDKAVTQLSETASSIIFSTSFVVEYMPISDFF